MVKPSGAAQHEVHESYEVRCCVVTSLVARYVVAQWWLSGAACHEVLESEQVKCCVTTSSVADIQWWPSGAAWHEVLERDEVKCRVINSLIAGYMMLNSHAGPAVLRGMRSWKEMRCSAVS
eukprot:1146926-Pelagomonas_calceolata.AAC.4